MMMILNTTDTTSLQTGRLMWDFVSGDLLQQFGVAHDQLPPVDKNHSHLSLCETAGLRHGLVEDLSDE